MGIAIVGDENDALPSHRELNAVRPMLGGDVATQWVATDGPGISDLSGFDGVWLVPGSPYADDAGAEVLELPGNRFFMLTLFQPQIGALAGKPVHPLLREFVRCAREYAAQAVAGAASSSASS
jgi:hypothetical protein